MSDGPPREPGAAPSENLSPAPPDPLRTSRWKARLAAIALGLAAPLVATEVALRISSHAYRRALVRPDANLSEGTTRLLCLGDSNTFGVWVERGETYPARLESLLNAGAPAGTRFQVLNAGLPGRNSALVRDDLSRELERTLPRLVLVLAGLNDGWNSAGRGGGAVAAAFDRLRIVKLARIAIHDWLDRRIPPARRELGVASGYLSVDELRRSIVGNLEAIVREARAFGAAVVLQTYPGQRDGMITVNDAIRDAAARTGALLVDHDAAFRVHVAERGAAAVLFDDGHPSALGYALMAEGLRTALCDANLVRSDPDAALALPTPRRAAELTLEPDSAGVPSRLHLRAEPGASFQLLISTAREPRMTVGFREIDLAYRAEVGLCLSFPAFRGELDGEGNGVLDLPPVLVEAARGWTVYAVFLTHDPRLGGLFSVRSISNSVAMVFR